MSKDFFVDKTFEELTPFDLQSIYYLRQQVFIIEQKCFYPDIDLSDPDAHHLMYFDGEDLKGYLRIFKPGVKFEDAVSIGRIVVASAHRGGDNGRKLIKKGIEVSKEFFNCRIIKIEAQAALDGYYSIFGFKSISEVYIVDDIPHKLMELTV